MYLSHYNLVKKPFQITTDPQFLWLGDKHKEALATLKYGVVDQKGFLLVTGDVGTGKTTLINALLENLENDTFVAYITNPALDLIDFFNFIAISFNIPKKFDNKVDFIVYFSRFLKEVYSENKHVLLIIDEAHNLSKDLLENIRLLSNIELPEQKLINIFFIGQNEINQTLASQECRALRQRIMLTYQIKPLSEIETFEYIKHRLKVAGTEEKLFNRKAIQKIYRFSNGYPRLINKICGHALLTGYVRDLKKIPPAIIEECSKELSLPGEIKKNKVSNFPDHPSNEHPPHFVTYPSTSPQQAERTKKKMHLEEETKVNTTQNYREPTVALIKKKLFLWGSAAMNTQKRMFCWGSAVTLAVIVMILVGLSNKGISSKDNLQKPTPPVNTAPPSYSNEPGRHFTSLTYIERGSTPTPAHSVEVPQAGKSKTREPIALELAKQELNNKNYSRSVELFEDIIARNQITMPEVKVYYSQALRGQAGRLLRKNPGEAGILLCKALEADPQNAGAHFDLGNLYTKSKDYSKAINAYQKAADLNYRSKDTFFNLGFIYASKKDYMNAEKMFLLAAESKPNYLDKALFNLAMVQQKQGKRNQCIDNLEKALIVNPENQRVRKYLNRFKNNSGKAP
ncbi:MAG: AAA family ATPase [Thermodesulfobacteriota bacterium]|nr:AAA family ATPase [Thermodesulfobacteriota bacterium]